MPRVSKSTSSAELAALDATAQAALVKKGDLTPLELVDAAIARVDAVNPQLNAVIHPLFDQARAAAARVPDAPFRGVPIVIKDLDGALAAAPYHLGNRMLRDRGHVADHDSYLNAKLRAAGFIPIGKTNTPEFGLLPTTEPEAYGPTHNPWDPSRSPGGSSGGTAAAVASGMVALGHGGDGGGSIRIPASMCGLVGLKPSRGRVSLGPDEGEAWSGLVVRHVLTKSVRDTAAVLDLLAGPMPGDPYTAPSPARAFAAEVGAKPRRLRIGVRTDATAGLAETDPACRRAAEEAGKLLESLGHSIEVASPAALDDVTVMASFFVIATTGVVHEIAELARIARREITSDDVEPLTWAQYELGLALSAVDYLNALADAHAWTRRVASWWRDGADDDGFDLLLTPTLCEPPPKLGDVASTPDDPMRALARATPFAAFTAAFNVTGQPAISLPTHRSDDGLPIGVQLVAHQYREDVLLRVAAQVEEAFPWDPLPCMSQ